MLMVCHHRRPVDPEEYLLRREPHSQCDTIAAEESSSESAPILDIALPTASELGRVGRWLTRTLATAHKTAGTRWRLRE